MHIYILPYIILLLNLLILLIIPDERLSLNFKRLLFFIAFIPAVAVATLRGNVGSDTGVYVDIVEHMLSRYNDTYDDYNIEIGFYYIMKVMSALFNDARFSINFISLIIASYSFYLFSKTKHSILIYSILIFPMFFYDMTMNGLRYGLAFLLAKHASDSYDSNSKFTPLILILVAINIQVSSIVVFILLQIKLFRLNALLYSVIFLAITYFIYMDRFGEKYLMYKDAFAPTKASGTVPLMLVLLSCVVLLYSKAAVASKYVYLFVFEVLAWWLTSVSYAGLRMQLLVLFVCFCSISTIQLKEYRYKRNVILFLFIIGLFGFIGKLNNFNDEMKDSGSPFLPYHFYWEAE